MLINENGENEGIIDRDLAISRAKSFGLDLVQFSNENPPICKIIDYGKFKYQQSKKDKKNHSNAVVVKEMWIGHNISDHDLMFKNKLVNEFLDKKYKVKYVLKLKGCPPTHYEKAKIRFREIIQSFVEKVDFGKEESGDKSISIMLAPKIK
jgi:translation initiation factor IF-3